MLLEPGPIPQLGPDLSSLAPEEPQFAPLTAELLAELPDIETGMDLLLGDLTTLEDPAEFGVIDLNLNTADEGLNELSAFSTGVHVDTADAAVTLAAGNLAVVGAEIPAEVWSPVPDSQTGANGGGPFPGVNGPTTLAIDNLTRPGDTTFYSGDSYQLTVQVVSGGGNYDFANKPIKLTRTLNGLQQDELDIGATDDFGRLVYRSTFNDSSIGDRVFGVDPPGWSTDPTVSITVKPGPAPIGGGGGGGIPGALSATIQNLSTQDASTFHVNDIWRELITGPPGQPVYLTQTKDGILQGEFFVGSTDANGALLIAGTISAAQIGSYVETFRVSTSSVPGQVVFSVVA